MTTPLTRRLAAATCIGTLAMAVLAGCERRQPEVPTPVPSFPVPPTPERTTIPLPAAGAAASSASRGN